MDTKIKSYKDLLVWQKSMELVEKVYGLTSLFPKSKIFGLCSQMRRCAVSIPSNIAEGKLRGTRKDFRQFLFVAFASGGELETQIELAKRLRYAMNYNYTEVDALLGEVMRMLNKLVSVLARSEPKT